MTKRPGANPSVRSESAAGFFVTFGNRRCTDADRQALWKARNICRAEQDEFAALGLTGCCSTVLACAENGDQVGLISIRG